jgi:hypothetical protein
MTLRHVLAWAARRDVHVIPSGLVITPFPDPETPTATKIPSAKVTLRIETDAGTVCPVHEIPSGLVITFQSLETATKSPFP